MVLKKQLHEAKIPEEDIELQEDGLAVRHRANTWKLWFEESFEPLHPLTEICSYAGYLMLYLWGTLCELLRQFGLLRDFSDWKTGFLYYTRDFVPLHRGFEAMFSRNMYRLVKDCWARPVCSTPRDTIELVERVSHDTNFSFEYTGRRVNVVNFGSYNYLGFAQNNSVQIDAVEANIRRYGVAACTPRQELGTSAMQRELERATARFAGQEDALVFPMGFATNALNIPALCDSRTCVVSDALCHASIILGVRLSGAHVRTFEHNDMDALESRLRDAVVRGDPRRRGRPYSKLVILVEGIYSMEGSIVKLPDVIRLKKKYSAYLYLDEAHSMGAVGPNGRGVVDYFGMDYRDVDVMMGTFTKSFAAAGGYIAGSRKLINYLRVHSHSNIYASTMSAPVTTMIRTVLRVLTGDDGTSDGRRRCVQLSANTRYFRQRLNELGFVVYGNVDSPVVPVIFSLPAKTCAFSREMLKRGIGVVCAGYPATPLTKSRARFCLSASHTREQLDQVLAACDEVGSLIRAKYSRAKPAFSRWWAPDAARTYDGFLVRFANPSLNSLVRLGSPLHNEDVRNERESRVEEVAKRKPHVAARHVRSPSWSSASSSRPVAVVQPTVVKTHKRFASDQNVVNPKADGGVGVSSCDCDCSQFEALAGNAAGMRNVAAAPSWVRGHKRRLSG